MVVVSQRAPNLADALGESVVRDEGVGPDSSKQVLLGDQSSLSFVEVGQYLKSLGSQPDLAPAAQNGPALQADRQIGHGFSS